jgi:hypothetical protein
MPDHLLDDQVVSGTVRRNPPGKTAAVDLGSGRGNS